MDTLGIKNSAGSGEKSTSPRSLISSSSGAVIRVMVSEKVVLYSRIANVQYTGNY